MYIWRFIWSQGHQGCSALSLIRQKLSALSKSVSISFQCIWGTHHPSLHPFSAAVLLNQNAKFIKDATAWGDVWWWCVCEGSCNRPAQLLPLRHPPWGEQKASQYYLRPIASSLSDMSAGWLTLQAPSTVLRSKSVPLSQAPFLIMTQSWKIIFLSTYLRYVSCEKS